MNPARPDEARAIADLERPPASLEASDDFEPHPAPARYCPTELLARFTLLMAGHGRCVSAAMMLGDRDYALWQLARAQAMSDPELCTVAARLFAWLDGPGVRGPDSARRL